MGTGGGMQRWKSAEGTAEDVVEKDKLPLKNYALWDSFDTFTMSFNYTRAYIKMQPASLECIYIASYFSKVHSMSITRPGQVHFGK